MPRVIFTHSDGKPPTEVTAEVGDTIMEVARDHDLDVEGACEGCMACATCHVIVDAAWYDRLPAPSDEEEDMLDLVFGLKDTSRLGCQIEMTEQLDGLTVALPPQSRNLLLD